MIDAEGDDGDNEERENEPAREGPRVLRDHSKIQTPSRYPHNANVAEYIVPMTYKEATNSTEAAQWAGAIQNEFKAHEENNTWKLVKRTPEMRLIDSKWVFRVKKDAEPEVASIQSTIVCEGLPTTRRYRLQGNVFSSGEI